MNEFQTTQLNEILARDRELAKKFAELKEVFAQKFGEDSDMYERATAIFLANALNGAADYGIPPLYSVYWKPYQTQNLLHHITTKKNVDSIRRHGLEPRDPSPRPWAGMKAVYMAEPNDPLYDKSEQAVLGHVRKKGENPVLLQIKTNNKLYKSIEPGRTFQVISVDHIGPEEIVDYQGPG